MLVQSTNVPEQTMPVAAVSAGPLSQKPPPPKWRDSSKSAAKWQAVEALSKSAIDLKRANLRLRAAAVHAESTWDVSKKPRATEFQQSPRAPKAVSATTAKHQLKQHDLVSVEMNRWWDMIARSSGAATTDAKSVVVTFPLYVELQLRLYKALMPGPFKHKEARAEAERGWQADCPRGGRSIPRPLLENSLFELVDQRTTSTTGEETAAFLDLLFDIVAAGCPPSMRPIDEVEYHDVSSEAAWVAAKAIGHRAKREAGMRAKAAKGVGSYGVLRSLDELHQPNLPPSDDDVAADMSGRKTATASGKTPSSTPNGDAKGTAKRVPKGALSPREMPFSFNSHGALHRFAIRPLTHEETDLEALSWRPEDGPEPLPPSERPGLKRTPRLSMTLSSNKASHIAGAPCAEPPSAPTSRPSTVNSGGGGAYSSDRSPRRHTAGVVLRPISQPEPVPLGEWAAMAAGTAEGGANAAGLAPRSRRKFHSPRYLEDFREAERQRESCGGPDVVPRPATVPFKAAPMRSPPRAFADQEAAALEANTGLDNLATVPERPKNLLPKSPRA